MKKIILTVVFFAFLSNVSAQYPLEAPLVNTAEVLLLKVDYTTNQFEGGQKLQFAQSPETFTVRTDYKEPGDFGWIKVYFAEIDELLFYGDIIWHGCGDIIYPATWRNADEFEHVIQEDYVTPLNGFENIFNPRGENYDYTFSVWSAVQGLSEVRQMLKTNPQQQVKMFLYTPSLGVGNPADWKWIIFLAGGNSSQNIIIGIELTPQSPAASDSVFLAVTSDLFSGGCTYTSNVDSIVENTIYVSGKYMGGAECLGKIDSDKTNLGKFKQGNYSVIYRLIDMHGHNPTETYTLGFEVSAQDYIQWKEWVIFDYMLPEGMPQPKPVGITYTIQGDTIIDGIRRGKFYYSLWTEQTLELTGYIHQTENRLYFRAAEGVNLPDKYILLCTNQDPEQEDVLLYDFTLETDMLYRDCSGDYILSDIQTVSMGNSQRKKYSFSSTMPYSFETCWIEGMGSTRNLFEPVSQPIADLYFKTLICFSQNNEVLWTNPYYQDFSGLTNDKPEVESSNSIRINRINEKSWLISSLSPMQEIRVYDAKGMLVLKRDTPDCLRYTLNGQSLNVGIYIITVAMQNGISEQKKLIIK